jgi:diaminopropionate ammonia-lyase
MRRRLHKALPGYRPTPLLRLHDLVGSVAIGRVYMKHEHQRFGLPAFKSLGASWAVYRWMREMVPEGLDQRWESFEQLRALAGQVGPLTLVTATDGNHGRAVAFVAKLFGFASHVLVPSGTAQHRIEAIEGEGAEVSVVDGDYDHTVAVAAALADDTHIIVSDTSWPGYRDIPTWIAHGYATMFEEVDEQLQQDGVGAPDLVIIPVGVGALAQAALTHYAHGTRVVAVEPLDAACLLASLEQGQIATVPGPHRSIMAGLNCGTPSQVAWPSMRDGFAAALAIDDRYPIQAIRWLAAHGIRVGETGAASLGALLALTEGRHATLRAALGLTPDSTVLLLATEGVTDPENYRRILGEITVDEPDVRADREVENAAISVKREPRAL